jgi:vacuolar protein sorting-associated protein 8
MSTHSTYLIVVIWSYSDRDIKRTRFDFRFSTVAQTCDWCRYKRYSSYNLFLKIAAQSGAVTALALSADHTVLLCGHSSGEIFTWDLSKPAQPHSHTPSLTPEQISPSRRDGHINGTAILHVDFLGLRHGAFVTADETGMAFIHTLSRKLVVASISTTRILGRYPERVGSINRPVKSHKPSSVLGMGGLPLGSVKYVTDEMQLVAMLSPYKVNFH